jgi:hypothetical protein
VENAGKGENRDLSVAFDNVVVVGVTLDPALHEPAARYDLRSFGPGRVQRRANELAAHSLALERRVDLGMGVDDDGVTPDEIQSSRVLAVHLRLKEIPAGRELDVNLHGISLVRPPDGDTSVSRSLTAFIPSSLTDRERVVENSQVGDRLWKNSQAWDKVRRENLPASGYRKMRVALRFQIAFRGNTKSIG